MDVIIVCHTEYGYTYNNTVIYDKNSYDGVTVGVNNLVKLANNYGAKITFAIMPEIIKHLPNIKNHEIGLHIHPGWQEFNYKNKKYFVGDQYLRDHCITSSTSTALRDYSYKEQLDMINVGKDCIIDTLGIEPKTFVAGRWSLNNDTIKALLNNKFTHDCSAPAHKKRSHYDWSKLSRICMPYTPSADDYQKKGDLPILIVPISQTLMGASVSAEGIPLVGLPWFKACFLEYYNQNMPLFHICLHSPYMTDPHMIQKAEECLKFMSKFDIHYKAASDVILYQNKSPKADILPYIQSINLNTIKLGIKTISRL